MDDLWIAYLGVHAWAVFTVLVRFADDRGRAAPSRQQIAHFAGTSLSEVGRSLKVLLASGLVRKAKKGSPTETTTYQIRNTPPSKNLKGQKPVAPQARPKSPKQKSVDATEAFLCALEEEGEESPAPAAPPPPKPKPAVKTPKLKRRLPESWEPDDKHAALALSEGVDLAREVEAFRDHAQATGRTMLDWDAAFRTWLKNARQFSKGYYGSRTSAFPERAARDEVQSFYETEEIV